MTSMHLRRDDVVVGVDTHKDEHAAVVLDGLGGKLDEFFVPATNAGYGQLLERTLGHVGPAGRLQALGVEGTGSYGVGLARLARRQGHTVREVTRPPRKGERRLSGKSDVIDAEHAARQVLAGLATAQPKVADGAIESLRLLKVVKDTAVKARSASMITLKATLVTAPAELREQLEPLSDFKLIEACAVLGTGKDLSDPTVAIRHALSHLAQRWLALHEEVKVHTKHMKTLTKQVAPAMVEAVGVGADIASEILITAGDNRDRVKSEASGNPGAVQPLSPARRRARASEVSSRILVSPAVLTNRGVRADFSPATTSRALFSWAVSVLPSRAARFPEYAHTARQEAGCCLGSQTGSALSLGSFSTTRLFFGVKVSMTCPSVNASPCQRKWEARSMGALVTREPTMNLKPASSSSVRLDADSIPASATTTTWARCPAGRSARRFGQSPGRETPHRQRRGTRAGHRQRSARRTAAVR